MSRKIVVSCAVLLALLLLMGCNQPNTRLSTVDQRSQDPGVTTFSRSPTTNPVATFGQPWTYDDGITVTVASIERARLSRYGSTSKEDGKVGDPVVVITVRVTNGSKGILSSSTTSELTYGPNGDEASEVIDGGIGSTSVMGKVLVGRTKSYVLGFLVPSRFWNDCTLEVTIDDVHDTAVFTGPLAR